eukprot:3009273-Pleurochrysis_carterae.AAC.2
MNVILADLLTDAVHGAGRLTSPQAAPAVNVDGGRITDGPRLSAYVRARIEDARVTPPAFASLRNLAATSPDQLEREPMPEGLADSQPTQLPGRRRRERGRPGLPRDSASQRARDAKDTARPGGAIAIEDLFLPGVYADKVQAWFRTADAAVAALRAQANGEDAHVPRVPTVTVSQ